MNFNEFEEMQKTVNDLKGSELGRAFDKIRIYKEMYIISLNPTWNEELDKCGIKLFEIEVRCNGIRSRVATKTQIDYLTHGHTLLLLSCETPNEVAENIPVYLDEQSKETSL